MKINLLISGIAVVNVNVLYLASQGFTQMFISMIGVELLMIAGYWELKNPAKDWLQAVPMLLISAIGSYTQYLCYPILGAPFLIFYIVVFIFFISINFKKKLYGYKIGVLFGLAGCFIPLIVWPSRLIEVFSQIPMFTSGVPGWPYMVAKPTALFFGSPMGTSWNIADILLFALFIIYVAKRLKDSDLHLKVAILGYLVVGILLTTIFGIRDGFNAYTTWKASYFVTPLAITIALMIFAKRYNTKKIENMFRMEILLSATLLLSFMSSYQAVINRSVPLTKFPISELTSALNLGQMNSTNTVALGPLDQLWATYSSNRQISPIAQNIHVSQKFSKLKKGDILVTYLDDLEAVKFCPNLDLSEFIELKSGVWYKTFEAKTEVKISC